MKEALVWLNINERKDMAGRIEKALDQIVRELIIKFGEGTPRRDSPIRSDGLFGCGLEEIDCSEIAKKHVAVNPSSLSFYSELNRMDS